MFILKEGHLAKKISVRLVLLLIGEVNFLENKTGTSDKERHIWSGSTHLTKIDTSDKDRHIWSRSPHLIRNVTSDQDRHIWSGSTHLIRLNRSTVIRKDTSDQGLTHQGWHIWQRSARPIRINTSDKDRQFLSWSTYLSEKRHWQLGIPKIVASQNLRVSEKKNKHSLFLKTKTKSEGLWRPRG